MGLRETLNDHFLSRRVELRNRSGSEGEELKEVEEELKEVVEVILMG